MWKTGFKKLKVTSPAWGRPYSNFLKAVFHNFTWSIHEYFASYIKGYKVIKSSFRVELEFNGFRLLFLVAKKKKKKSKQSELRKN